MQVRRGSDPHAAAASYRQFANATPMAVDDQQTYYAHSSSSSATLVQQEAATGASASGGGGESETYDSLPDAAAFDSKCSLNVLRRREPLGASAGNSNNNKQEKGGKAGGGGEHQWSVAPSSSGGEDQNNMEFQQIRQHQMVRPSVEIVIPNEIGPLGIHVVPSKEEGPGPLIVQGIEPGGRVDRDGRLAVGDEIMEINGYPLTSVSFSKAQEIFKEALFAKELKLRVVKGVSDVVAAAASAETMAAVAAAAAAATSAMENKENLDRNALMASPFQQMQSQQQQQQLLQQPPESPVVGCKVTAAVQANNTRKIGRVINITLVKGSSGLGFSITTRDNAPGGQTPVYIKNIMPKGAAIEEGTLKPGDRLLEVNGTSVDGMAQSEVVALLRNAEPNSRLELAVSRHSPPSGGGGGGAPGEQQQDSSAPGTLKTVSIKEDEEKVVKRTEPPSPVRGAAGRAVAMTLAASASADDADQDSSGSGSLNFPWRQREILTFDIPVHDSELAGLGVSVKGKTSTNGEGGVVDLGIFVKSVLHGGAASRDGRLRTNDQLVNINGASLLGKPNPQAMETLRKAMHKEGPMPGIISLTVARQVTSSSHQQRKEQHQQHFSRGDQQRESFSSQVTSSSDDLVREYSVSAPVFKTPQGVPRQQQQHPQLPGRNPVIDRLMGKESAGIVPSNMRNESYYMATHETWNATVLGQQQQQQQQQIRIASSLDCPTVHQRSGESLMIEQDGSGGGAGEAMDATSKSDGAAADVTRGSAASLSDGYQPFARDQPGRQSMSEKRHATLDAKATDTYQKRKKARDERLRMQQQEHRALRWKKSASVESLHLIGAAEAKAAAAAAARKGRVEYLTPEEREALKTQYVRASSVRVSRSRGCNESFRQAVDRSYEDQEEEDEGRDFEIEDMDDQEVADVVKVAAAAAASAKKKNRNSKLLRNFGAMFRFGSGGRGHPKHHHHHHHRKSTPSTPTPHSGGGVPRPSTSSLPVSQSVPDYQTYGKSHSGTDIAAAAGGGVSDFVRPYQHQQPQPQQHLESQHQRALPSVSHQQQQHPFYQHPHQQHQQYFPAPPQPPPPRQEVYDYLPSAIMRPGSRVGIADPGANTASSDYEVIQRHLHRSRVPYHQQQVPPHEQQHHQQQQQQQHYQPQFQAQKVPYRQPRSHSNPAAPRARPKSNFYEYDMWSAAGESGGVAGSRAPPVPQKPSNRAVQQHFSNIAATDPYLYGAQQQQQQQQQHLHHHHHRHQHRARATSSMEHQLPFSVRGQQQTLH